MFASKSNIELRRRTRRFCANDRRNVSRDVQDPWSLNVRVESDQERRKGKFVEREITLGAGCRIEWTSVFEG